MAGRPRKQGKRERNGRIKRDGIKSQELSIMEPTLQFRCREMGWPLTQGNLRRVRSDHFCCQAGRAIDRQGYDKDLWEAAKHIFMVKTRYRKAIGAPNPNPKGMSIVMEPERMESGAIGEHSAAEPLSEDEIVMRATKAFMTLEHWLGAVAKLARSETLRVVVEDEEPKDIAGLMAGLRVVADGLAGRSPYLRRS